MSVLLYGATGYTGRLITRVAAEYGIRPIIAGRNAAAIEVLARAHDLEHRVFPLHDTAAIARALGDVSAVLHCAGPFIHTSEPMASACIRAGAHYIDVTGEIEVLEQLHARDAEARAARVMLLPGAGFDVVPSDCLAAHLKLRLPAATRLELAIAGGGRLSRGTASTMVEHVGGGAVVRRNGKLVRVGLGEHTREVDFGSGRVKAVTISWGDVATAYYSTGIPNIEVYSVLPRRLRRVLRLARHATGLLRARPIKKLLLSRIRARPAGPSEAELRTGRSHVWGQVTDSSGSTAQARCVGPNGYLLTAHTALLVLQRVLAGDVRPGFQTPSLAYGPDFVLAAPNVVREDL